MNSAQCLNVIRESRLFCIFKNFRDRDRGEYADDDDDDHEFDESKSFLYCLHNPAQEKCFNRALWFLARLTGKYKYSRYVMYLKIYSYLYYLLKNYPFRDSRYT